MLLLWLVASLVRFSVCGELYSTVEAHGPLARQALDIYRSGGFHYPKASAPLVTPAVAAPLAASVHHAPAVADVPITSYLAQPGYVQKLVNIPKTDIATAKLQVKRPAVQKQFYDIEHRTVVRPVGSAVVEFDQPVSKKYVSPFIDSTGGRYTLAQFQRPLVYPIYSYPFYVPQQVPAQTYPPSFIQIPGPVNIPQRPVQPPQQIPVQPQRPVTPVRPSPPAPIPSIPSPDEIVPEFDPTDTVVINNPDFTRARNTTESPKKDVEDTFEDFAREVEDSDNTKQILDEFENRQKLRQTLRQNSFSPGEIQQFGSFKQMPNVSQEKSRPNLSVKIVTETSESEPFAESETETSAPSELDSSTESEIETNSEETHVLKHSEHDFSFRIVMNNEHFDDEAQNPEDENVHNVGFIEHVEPNFNVKIVPLAENIESSDNENSNEKPSETEHDFDDFHNILEHSEPNFNFKIIMDSKDIPQETHSSPKPETHEHISTTIKTSSSSERNNPINEKLLPSSRKLTNSELQENQRKLIELLTGQGLISEIALTRAGITLGGPLVRGRVVSVTPAPASAKAEERVSTRRVVVSQPVHTVEEVDVHHPVTKIERVAVHQPALVTTAHTQLTRVPATLPILHPGTLYH